MSEPPAKKPALSLLYNPFDTDQDNECDVTIIAKDEKLCLHSSLLCEISEELKEMLSENEEKQSGKRLISQIQKQIVVDDIDAEIVIQAFSFYYPKYFEGFTDSSNFNELLKMCKRYGLGDLKEHIQVLLLNTWNQLTSFNAEQYSSDLRLAEYFQLEKLRLLILQKTITFEFEELKRQKSFIDLSWQNKYEIIKKCISQKIQLKGQNSAECIELHGILNFLDLLFYEGKVYDHYVPSKFKSHDEETVKEKCKIEQIFVTRTENTDVTIKVDGIEIYFSSFVLSQNSPVFKAMLNSTFKEGKEKVINLPGKSAKEITELLSYFHVNKPCDNNGDVDLFSILPLCREYQVDWLIVKLKAQLKKLTFGKTEEKLQYFRLAEEMEFSNIKRTILKSIHEPFIMLQTLKEFSLLNRASKFFIAGYRIAKLLSNYSYSKSIVMDMNHGLYFIYFKAENGLI